MVTYLDRKKPHTVPIISFFAHCALIDFSYISSHEILKLLQKP